MTNLPKKRKTPIVSFLLVFAAIIIVMLVVNVRSMLEFELSAPANGVRKLYTVGNQLVAVSPGNEVYVWNWDALVDKPETGSVRANNVVWLPGNQLIWTPKAKPGTVVISDLTDGKEHKRFTLGSGWVCKYISVSRNGRFVVLGLVDNARETTGSGRPRRLRLDTISVDSQESRYVIIMNAENDGLDLRDFTISDDGAFIAIAGEKNNSGWIAVVSVAQKRLLWEKSLQTLPLTEAVFSPDDKVIYTGGIGRAVYGLETASGSIVSKLLMDEYETSSFKRQHITCIAVSQKGCFLAVGSEPDSSIHLWDTISGKVIHKIGSGYIILSGLAFAPDGSLLAVSCRVKEKVKLFHITK